MSVPTFNGTALFDGQERERFAPRRPRAYIETLPGADGAYVQTHGVGERTITVEGVLSYDSSGGRAAAVQMLKDKFRDRQELADGATVAAYVGADGQTYSDCILTDYQQTSPVWQTGGKVCINVTATVVSLTY
jgi:hypothetical protein